MYIVLRRLNSFSRNCQQTDNMNAVGVDGITSKSTRMIGGSESMRAMDSNTMKYSLKRSET